jgi:hypothetical protein
LLGNKINSPYDTNAKILESIEYLSAANISIHVRNKETDVLDSGHFTINSFDLLNIILYTSNIKSKKYFNFFYIGHK